MKSSILWLSAVGVIAVAIVVGDELRADGTGADGLAVRLQRAECRIEELLKRLERVSQTLERHMAGGAGSAEARASDLKRIRDLAALMLLRTKLPFAEGALDVYRIARDGELPTALLPWYFWSARSSVGPTNSEIKAADYSHFPYARLQRDDNTSEACPLLWDKEPQADGQRLVAFTDGTARYVSGSEWTRLAERLRQR